LVVLVHVDQASQQHSGHRFIADVLHANGLATLLITLHSPEEQRRCIPPPGQVQVRHRVCAVFDWLSTQPACAHLPVALLGIDDAVRGCVAAAARYRPAALRSLILLDGRPHRVSKLLTRLSQPTLMLVGATDSRTLNRHRAAFWLISAPSRFEGLGMATRPIPAPGAHQAIAHATLNWLDKTMWAEDLSRASGRGGALPTKALVQGAPSTMA
jgi:hypothetical protein